jgi:hypothetical protein
MSYTRPRSRGEAAPSCRRRSLKISASDRSVLHAHESRDRVGNLVPSGVETIDAVGWQYVVFGQRDRRVRRSGGYPEALRTVSSRRRAS